MSFLSSEEAARVLGVRPDRVRTMLRTGSLRGELVGGRWLVPRAAVEDRLARRPRPGRPMSATIARAMVDLVGQHLGEEPGTAWTVIPQPHQSRLRRRWEQLLDDAHPAELLRSWLPHRCHAERFDITGDPREMFNDPRLHPGGAAHPALGLAGGSLVEPHVAEVDRADVVAEHLLVPRADGAVLLRSEPVVRVDLAACLVDIADLGGGRNDRAVANVLHEAVVR